MKYSQIELKKILYYLNCGYELNSILNFIGERQEIIDKIHDGEIVFIDYLIQNTSLSYRKILSFFLNFFSLKESIEISVKIVGVNKELTKFFLKNSSYPLFISFFSLLIIFVFINYVIPSLMSNFGFSQSMLIYLIYILDLIVKMSFLMFMFLLIFFVFFIYSFKFKRYAFPFLSYIFPIIKEFSTYSLVVYLKVLNEVGISTYESFQLLEFLNDKSLTSIIIYRISKKLHRGISFENCLMEERLISKSFKDNFYVSNKKSEYLKFLNNYLIITKENLVKKINFFSIVIQFISYILVGMLMLTFYQVILAPLNIIDKL